MGLGLEILERIKENKLTKENVYASSIKGFDERDIKVEIKDKRLIISGYREENKKTEGGITTFNSKRLYKSYYVGDGVKESDLKIEFNKENETISVAIKK